MQSDLNGNNYGSDGDRFYSCLSSLSNLLERVGGCYFFMALRRALLLVFPLTIIGATALCALHFPVQYIQQAIYGPISSLLQVIVDGTFGVAALAMLCSMSYCLGEMYNNESEKYCVHPFLYCVVSIGCYFVLVGNSVVGSFTQFTSISHTMLEAIFTASVSSWAFSRILRQKLRISVSSIGYDLFSKEIFSVVPSCVIVISLFLVFRCVANYFGYNSFYEITEELVLSIFYLVHGDFWTGLLYVLLCQLLWFFGAHGPNVLQSVNTYIVYPNSLSNMAAESMGVQGHVLTQGFLDAFTTIGGSGFTLSLIIAIIIASRDLRNRQFSIMACLVCLFNINEPLLFGIPLILNPVYFIPFVFTPVVTYSIAYAASASGALPLITSSFHWTTPVFVSGYHATGNWTGAFMQAGLLGLGVIFYIPFVKLSECLQSAMFRRSMDSMVRAAEDAKSGKKSRFVGLPGLEGFTARTLGDDLREALQRNDQLYVVFQPQVNVLNRCNIGAEALLRWNHPRYGLISPEITIALAEDLECIEELTYFVLREACRHLEHWRGTLSCQPYVSVNLTPSLITDELAGNIMQVVRASDIPPQCMELEITESDAINNDQATINRLDGLRCLGFRIAIDDFGMGHTSLRYLREMPVDKVKIDRSLTLESAGGVNRHIVNSIIDLCRKIDLRVIIEGVETAEQLASFREIGARSFQGYHFSRPLSAEDCYLFIRNWTGNDDRDFYAESDIVPEED